MPVTLAIPRSSRVPRRGVLGVGVLGIAAALAVATLSNPWLGHAVGEGIKDGLQGMETVAAMLADRSPGARPEGALTNLKHKRQALLQERGAPSIPAPPTAYEALASPPPPPPIAPLPEAPLYTTVAGGPAAPVTPAAGGTPGGGPPILSEIPLPGGGGGGGFTPPITPAVTPQVPVTPAAPVPEPASWTMMLLGFALVGRALGRHGGAGLRSAGG